jgi:hypothetical protein
MAGKAGRRLGAFSLATLPLPAEACIDGKPLEAPAAGHYIKVDAPAIFV